MLLNDRAIVKLMLPSALEPQSPTKSLETLIAMSPYLIASLVPVDGVWCIPIFIGFHPSAACRVLCNPHSLSVIGEGGSQPSP